VAALLALLGVWIVGLWALRSRRYASPQQQYPHEGEMAKKVMGISEPSTPSTVASTGLLMAFTMIMTWIFNHTRGSLFATISAHASVDAPQLAFLPLFPAVGATSLTLGFTLGLGVPALLILILTRGRLGYKPN